MRRYLANTFLCFTVLASGLGFAHAQERQTSFTPTDALSAPPDEISQPIVITAPVLAPPGTASAAQPTRPVASPVATTPPAPTNTPTAPTPTTVAPTARAAAFAPAKAGVEATALDALDPDAGGLLSTANGSLGANMWQDTPRALVDRLLPELSLPTNSAALNNLARRLLLTTAQLPNGKSANTRSLTSMRVEKLLTLGNSAEAWQLAHLNKMERLDDLTLRMMTEAVVLNNDVKDICGQVPGLMVGHDGLEWQKMMVVCQLRSGDNKAAQLSVDVMREQSVKDDIFLSLINKNIFNTSKLLPRQLTPLKPMNLALLRQIDLPLPTELFGRPDTVLAQQLLQAKAADDGVKLAYAEKLTTRGLVNANDMAELYRSFKFQPEALANAINTTETGAKQHALLYQAAAQEQEPARRLVFAARLLQSLDAGAQSGGLIQVLADLVKDIPVRNDLGNSAVVMTRVLSMAGKPDLALPWYKLARANATTSAEATAQVHTMWPALVLSGMITDAEYSQELGPWLDFELGKDADRTKRQQIGTALTLFAASGFAVPEEAWGRTADVATESKRILPPATALLERLRTAGATERKGEAAMLAILLAGSGAGETPYFVLTDIVRALRLAGMKSDAQNFAREVASYLFAPTTP